MSHRAYKIALSAAAIVMMGSGCSSVVDGGMFVSDDGGRIWTQKVFVAQDGRRASTISALNIEDIVIDPSNEEVVYIATRSQGVWKTETAGEQWRQLSLRPERIRDIAIDAQETDTLYVVRGNTILKSVDGGDGWEIMYTDSQGSIITRLAVDWFNSDRVYATTSIGTVLLSEDAGLSWRVIYQVDEPIIGVVMSHEDSRDLYIVELDRSVHRTTDSGVTWEDLFTKEVTGLYKGMAGVKSITMDPNNASTLYVITDYGLFRTTDDGDTWEPITTLIEFRAEQNAAMTGMTVRPGRSQDISFALGRILHVSNDGGITWETLEQFPSQRRITDVAWVGSDSERVYAGVQEIEEEKRGFLPTR